MGGWGWEADLSQAPTWGQRLIEDTVVRGERNCIDRNNDHDPSTYRFVLRYILRLDMLCTYTRDVIRLACAMPAGATQQARVARLKPGGNVRLPSASCRVP